MSKRVKCPLVGHKKRWIELPDKWLGKHAQRHDEAFRTAQEAELGDVLGTFAVAIALLDNWNLPGLEGNPEQWDFTEIDLHVIGWVITETLPSYRDCWNVPKVSSSPSLGG